MYNQVQEDIFLMFYASVAMLSLIACCYLLFRRANAIAPEITSPVRLRRWTAALESGFRNYNTFGAAFKKTMGMNTTEWMRNVTE